MAIAFQRAPIIEPGDNITSLQLTALSNAFNGRLRSGLGDPTFRIFFLMFSMFRQVRNSDGMFAFPSMAEFFESYQMFGPDSGVTWPLAGPGEPEGANLVSLMPGFVYGVDLPQANNVGSEEERVYASYEHEDLKVVTSPADIKAAWDGAKHQRGGYAVLGNGEVKVSSPIWAAASAHYNLELKRSRFSPHALAYGGLMPYSIWGAIGCELFKTRDILDRVLNFYIKDFKDFDFEKFFGTQYLLAPAKGVLDAAGEVAVTYPVFGWFASSSKKIFTVGSVAGSDTNPNDTTHAFDNRSVLGAVYFECSKLDKPVTVQVCNGNRVIKEVILATDTPQVVHTFQNMERPNPLSFKLKTQLEFSANDGYVKMEFLEINAYKPEIPDAYLVLRAAGGVKGVGGGAISDWYFKSTAVVGAMFDKSEVDETAINKNHLFDAARRMSLFTRVIKRTQLRGYEVDEGKSVLYFSRNFNGTDLFEGLAPPSGAITSDKIQQGLTYKVTGTSGYVTYNGENYGVGSTFVGQMSTASPDLIPTTIKSYTLSEGANLAVMQVDGIIHIAPAEGWTNEWLMGVQLKNYNPNEGSMFSADLYADYFPLANRCLFLDRPIHPLSDYWDLSLHYNYGQDLNLAPEAPSGFNFLHHVRKNKSAVDYGQEVSTNFYKSCQIYQPDPEIESITMEPPSPIGEQIIKVKFKTRFQHCDTAPDSVPLDASKWDLDALSEEPYRTMENGIRQYMVSPKRLCGVKTGDTSIYQNNHFNSDFWGACYPHFFFTKLVPVPYNDNNGKQDCNDTPVSVETMTQMEMYLRAMSEGYLAGYGDFVDTIYDIERGETKVCAGGSYDYTFRLLCARAFGGEWGLSYLPGFGPNPELPCIWGTTNPKYMVPLRPDKPKGFGTLPNTRMYASVFNQYSRCLNLLNTVRVEIPLDFETRERNFRSFVPASVSIQGVCENYPDLYPSSANPCTGQANRWSPVTTCTMIGTIPGGGDATEEIPACNSEWRDGFALGTSITVGLAVIARGEASPAVIFEGKPMLEYKRSQHETRVKSTSVALAALPPYVKGLLGSLNVSGIVTYDRTWGSSYQPTDKKPYEDAANTVPYSLPAVGKAGVIWYSWNDFPPDFAAQAGCYLGPPPVGEKVGSRRQVCKTLNTSIGANTLQPDPLHSCFLFFKSFMAGLYTTSGSATYVTFYKQSCTSGLSVTIPLIGTPPKPPTAAILNTVRGKFA